MVDTACLLLAYNAMGPDTELRIEGGREYYYILVYPNPREDVLGLR